MIKTDDYYDVKGKNNMFYKIKDSCTESYVTINNIFEQYGGKIIFLLLFLQALKLFLLYRTYGIIDEVDTNSYVEPAKMFLQTGRMLWGGVPTPIRTPGYILFLATIYKVFGEQNGIVIFLQCIMCLLNSYMLFYCIKKITRNAFLAVIAVFFYTMDLAVYFSALSIMTDVFFSFLLLASVTCFIKWMYEKKLCYFLYAIIIVNYALLVRPQLMYLSILFVFVLFAGSSIKRIPWKATFFYLCCFSIVFGGWSMRNYKEYGKFTYTTIRDVNIFAFDAMLTYSMKEGVSEEEASIAMNNKLYQAYPEIDSMKYMEQLNAKKEVGNTYLKENFGYYILVNLKGLATEMVAPGMTGISKLNLPEAVKKVIAILHGGLLLVSYFIYGFYFLKNFCKLKVIDWMIFVIAAYLMASSASVGYSRFRLSFYPFVLLGGFILKEKKTPIVINKE